MKKNQILIRMKLLLLCSLLILFSTSCSKDTYDSSGISASLSKKLLADPLFEQLDKAQYKSSIARLKEGNSKEKLNSLVLMRDKLASGDLKTNRDYKNFANSIGYKQNDSLKKLDIDYQRAIHELFQKYPELSENKNNFMKFFNINRKHSISVSEFESIYLETHKAQSNL